MKCVYLLIVACLVTACHSKKTVTEVVATDVEAAKSTTAEYRSEGAANIDLRRWLSLDHVTLTLTADSVYTPDNVIFYKPCALISAEAPRYNEEITAASATVETVEVCDSSNVKKSTSLDHREVSSKGSATPPLMRVLIVALLILGFWRLTVFLKS